MSRILPAAFVCLWFWQGSSAGQILLDRFIARVNGNVILDSDLQFEMAQQTLDSDAKNRPATDRATVLQILIDRELLMDQARKFITRQLNETEVQNRIDELDRKYGGIDVRLRFLDANGMTEEFWRLRIRNQILLEKYIDQRFRAFVRISKEDEDRYIAAHVRELNLDHFDDPIKAVPEDHILRTMVRKLLVEQVVNERISEFLKELRSSASIHLTEDDPQVGVESISDSNRISVGEDSADSSDESLATNVTVETDSSGDEEDVPVKSSSGENQSFRDEGPTGTNR
ncbi:SurA N-terminal domain-containing protein [bacterium]|nr:SurA N-terminal domain-containing protein [candidate division CSSED10-310 bacterium]